MNFVGMDRKKMSLLLAGSFFLSSFCCATASKDRSAVSGRSYVKWEPQEVQMLLRLQEQLGGHWREIARRMPENTAGKCRTGNRCQGRFKKIMSF